MNGLYQQVQDNLRATVPDGNIAPTRLPLVPEVSLYLLQADYPRGPMPSDAMIAIMNAPAYWAFCWASGQVLARYILDHPHQFTDRIVLDFGCGSGVIGIAAALAGARRVIACDIDPKALTATRANGGLNGVELDLLDDVKRIDCDPDIAIAADVLYDRDNLPWLERLPEIANEVLIADSRIKTVELHGYTSVFRETISTLPDLDELREYSNVTVYRSLARPGV